MNHRFGLNLRRESLGALESDELSQVVGGSHYCWTTDTITHLTCGVQDCLVSEPTWVCNVTETYVCADTRTT